MGRGYNKINRQRHGFGDSMRGGCQKWQQEKTETSRKKKQ